MTLGEFSKQLSDYVAAHPDHANLQLLEIEFWLPKKIEFNPVPAEHWISIKQTEGYSEL